MPVMTVSEIFESLKGDPSSVVLSDVDAGAVYTLFTGAPMPGAVLQKSNGRAFLQAAFMAAIDASNEIGVIQALWQSSVTPSTSLAAALRKIVTGVGRTLISRRFAANPKIYQMVVDQIRRSHRYEFEALVNPDLSL